MLNYIWLGMLVIGFLTGIATGRAEQVTQAAMSSANNAVELCIGLMGIMCLWTGLMEIAQRSGLIRLIATTVRPLMRLLFPEVPINHPAMGAVIMNLAANSLGLGNAATPLGIKAMTELQKLNTSKETSTNAMSMFLVLNTSAIQLIPATIIALRVAEGSRNPAEITVTIWIASICASITGIAAVKLFSKIGKGRQR